MKISKKLVYQYMAIFLNFYTTSNHLHPLQAENCDSNSRLVVDEDDNGKFRVERVNPFVTSPGDLRDFRETIQIRAPEISGSDYMR